MNQRLKDLQEETIKKVSVVCFCIAYASPDKTREDRIGQDKPRHDKTRQTLDDDKDKDKYTSTKTKAKIRLNKTRHDTTKRKR